MQLQSAQELRMEVPWVKVSVIMCISVIPYEKQWEQIPHS